MKVRMPQLGESVTEGTVAKWLKQPGDQVRKFEPLCEVITDKVNAEIPSDAEGVLSEILVREGETVPVGTVMAVIAEDRGESEAGGLARPETDVAAAVGDTVGAVLTETGAGRLGHPRLTAQTGGPEEGRGRSRFSPAVARLLQEHNLNPALIAGTGVGGRITRKDVLAFLEQGGTAAGSGGGEPLPAAAPEIPEPPVPVKAEAVAAGGFKWPPPAQTLENGDTAVPVTAIRQTIAKRMLESKQTAPHAWTMVEADVTNLVKFRDSVKETFKRQEGIPLTFLPFFIKAAVETLREFPMLNSTWAGDRIIIKKRIHISIAVATDDALFVPVIKDADRLSISGLAHAIHDLAAKARAGKLTPDDVAGGTFTVNNTGAFGSILSKPILNSPQAAVLTTESIGKRPVVVDHDAIAIRSVVNLCLSFDHRTLDGLVCGRFLAAIKRRLETFDGNRVHLY